MAEKHDDLKKEIDNDEGLKSKRKLLTITSLVLLAIQFSGAKVVEANTFILKMSFSNQGGIAFLLMLAVFFLMIRYYNYARPYHEKLFILWSSRMLTEPFFYLPNQHEPDPTGLVIDILPDSVNVENWMHSEFSLKNLEWVYSCHLFLNRKIIFSWSDEYDYHSIPVSLFKKVQFKAYLKILSFEFKYQVSSFFTHRENLDIFTPYLLGVLAVLGYFFNVELQHLLEIFLQK